MTDCCPDPRTIAQTVSSELLEFWFLVFPYSFCFCAMR